MDENASHLILHCWAPQCLCVAMRTKTWASKPKSVQNGQCAAMRMRSSVSYCECPPRHSDVKTPTRYSIHYNFLAAGFPRVQPVGVSVARHIGDTNRSSWTSGSTITTTSVGGDCRCCQLRYNSDGSVYCRGTRLCCNSIATKIAVLPVAAMVEFTC